MSCGMPGFPKESVISPGEILGSRSNDKGGQNSLEHQEFSANKGTT